MISACGYFQRQKFYITRDIGWKCICQIWGMDTPHVVTFASIISMYLVFMHWSADKKDRFPELLYVIWHQSWYQAYYGGQMYCISRALYGFLQLYAPQSADPEPREADTTWD